MKIIYITIFALLLFPAILFEIMLIIVKWCALMVDKVMSFIMTKAGFTDE